jgi:hypothetical protein
MVPFGEAERGGRDLGDAAVGQQHHLHYSSMVRVGRTEPVRGGGDR